MMVQTRPARKDALAAWRVRLGQRSLTWGALALLLVGLLGLHLLTLTRQPAPFNDEAWFTSHALGLIETGWPFGPVDHGVFQNYDGYWTFFPWLQAWFRSLPFRLLGLSLFTARLTSLAFGMLLLLALYVIGQRLGGPRLGFLTVTLVGLSAAFRFSAHWARPDIMVVAAGFGAIALYLTDRASGWSLRSVLAGLLLGLAFEIHPNAALFGPVIGLLFLADHGWSTMRLKRFWGFVGGGFFGLGVYAALHLLRYAETFAKLTFIGFGSTRVPPLLNPNEWLEALAQLGLLMLILDPARFGLALVGGVVLWRARLPGARAMLIIFGVLMVELLAVVPYKPPYYGILVGPAIDLVVAGFLAHIGWRPLAPSRWLRVGHAIVLGLVAGSIVGALYQLRDDVMPQYQLAVSGLRQATPAGSLVMGEPKYWFGLTDYPFLAWHQVTLYRRHAPGSTLDDAFRHFRPDYLIVDEHMDLQVTDEPGRLQPWAQLQYLPKTEWNRFLAQRATLVAVVVTKTFGPIRLYRLNWS